jgi:hypothetical protein
MKCDLRKLRPGDMYGFDSNFFALVISLREYDDDKISLSVLVQSFDYENILTTKFYVTEHCYYKFHPSWIWQFDDGGRHQTR